MKFGKQIQSQQVPGWAGMYLDYKGLKRIINSLAKGSPADAAILASGLQPASISNNNSEPPQLPTGSNESAILQAHKAAFFFKLERELEKINEFYLSKEADLKVRLRSLIDKRKLLETRAGGNLLIESSVTQSLCEGFRMFEKDLHRLQQFMEINATGFRKILKKWDKRSKSQTKELYLARQVEVQPCFNHDIIAQLSDAAASNMVQLESGRCLDQASELPSNDTQSVNAAAEQVSPLLPPGFIEPDGSVRPAHVAHAAAIDYQELETSLIRAVSTGNFVTISDLLSNLPINSATMPILWRATLEIPLPIDKNDKILQRYSDLINRLDFSFIDDINSKTALHEAALSGKLQLAQLCVQNGVSVIARDIYGRQALHYAAMNGHVEMSLYLLQNGAELLIVDMDGFTPVTYAVVKGCLDCVKIFLEADDTGSIIDNNNDNSVVVPGLQPLLLACHFGHVDIVNILLQRNVSISPNESGLFPQHIAAREGHLQVLNLLSNSGAQMDLADNYSAWTPLFHAASEGKADCVQFLLSVGANVYSKDEFDKTAVHYAGWHGNMACVNILLNAMRTTSSSSPLPPTTTTSSSASSVPSSSSASTLAFINNSNNNNNSKPVQKSSPLIKTTTSDGIASPPTPPSAAGKIKNKNKNKNNDNMDIDDGDDDMVDGIPDLSLPPPILPTRLYGHSYLSHDTLVHVTLGHTLTGQCPKPPVQLYGQSQLSSLKLLMTSKPDSYAMPHSVILPLADEREVFPFKVASLNDLSLEFDLSPNFGSRLLGRGVALVSMFSDLKSVGQYSVPLIDVHLKTIGEVNFEISIIHPFKGVQLEIGGQIETYWKSTETPSNVSNTMAATSLQSQSQSQPSLSSSSTPAHSQGGGGHPPRTTIGTLSTMTTDPFAATGHLLTGPPVEFQSNSSSSFITASSLFGDYIRIVVQVTRDYVPVVYALWDLPVEEDVNLRVMDVTSKQFNKLSSKMSKTFKPPSSPSASAQDWYHAIANSLVTLSDVLHLMPQSLGVNIEIRYPTISDIDRNGLHSVLEVNDYVNSVLDTVYGTMNDKKKQDDQAHKFRRFIFSSFNPIICTALNWKQPNYAVFFASYCGRSRSSSASTEGQLVPANRNETDRRCTSIREAVKFAASNNLLGLLLDGTIMEKIPSLIRSAKEHGLLVTTFGHNTAAAAVQQETALQGADGYLDLSTGILTHQSNNDNHQPSPTEIS